jgi:hypothetical protein
LPNSGKRRETTAVKMGEVDSHQPAMSKISLVIVILVVGVGVVTITALTKGIHRGMK